MSQKFSKTCHVSFHTPGHSGEAYKGRGIFDYDLTELSCTDNLLSPTGELKELCARWAEVYSGGFARLVTAGATSAITACLDVLEGTPLIIGDCHLSIYNTLKKKGGKAIVAKDIAIAAECLKKDKIDYLIFTYPDYLGRDNGLAKAVELKTLYSIPLFIDSAHGSHFEFCDKLPVSASECGDLVVYSLHKTLPVCTGGALIVGDKKYETAIGVAIRTTHTTSPSFMTIESFKWALEELKDSKKNYDFTLSSIDLFLEDIAKDSRYTVVKTDDKTRLVIDSIGDNYRVAAMLEECGIYPEGVCDEGVIFIVTPYNAKHLSLLALTLKGLDELGSKKPPFIREGAVRVLEFAKSSYELVDLDQAVGRRLYGEIGFYPPATPIYFYGDVLEDEDIKKIKEQDNIFGLENGKAVVLK